MSPQEFRKWLEDNQIPESVRGVIRYPTLNEASYEEINSRGGEFEFYIKLEYLGNKHYVDSKNKDKLAEWLKLTAEILS